MEIYPEFAILAILADILLMEVQNQGEFAEITRIENESYAASEAYSRKQQCSR